MMISVTINLLKFAFAAIDQVKARAKILAREDRLMRSALVEIRREHGMTQQDVADLMGVSQQAVNKLERYDADPKLSTLRRYANAIGAIVEHRVTEDRGQSLLTQLRTNWQASSIKFDNVIYIGDESADLQRAIGTKWSEAKRTDLALSA